jgi:two-component system KDP operon response regulator KdpE
MSDRVRKLLVLEDEPRVRALLRRGLESRGERLGEAAGTREALARCARASPDLLILELGADDGDGAELIDEIRSWPKVPTLVLSVAADQVETARTPESASAAAAGAGAELLARVRGLLREGRRAGEGDGVLEVGPLALDLRRRRVTLRGEALKLSPKEFELLRLLMAHAGQVLTHKALLREIWGPAHESDVQYLRVYIGQLREKLRDDPAQPRFIANEPGVGYRFLEAD